MKSNGIPRSVKSSRVLGDRTGYGLYARGTETIIRDIEAKQGAVGEKHGGDGLTPRASKAIAREKQPASGYEEA